MNIDVKSVSNRARQAAVARDWNAVAGCAKTILECDPVSAEGYFLKGLAERAVRRFGAAAESFERAYDIDKKRYDAAVELANVYSIQRRNGEAAKLLDEVTPLLSNSPRYLDLAGTVYTDIGLSDRAWPLFVQANALQPGIDMFEGNLATCAVFLGKIDEGRAGYKRLLARNPGHRKNHYQLSRLAKATDFEHIEQMRALLGAPVQDPAQNIPILFAIAKELEDLEQWEDCFKFYQQACDAVCRVTGYQVDQDIQLIDKLIETCSLDWLNQSDDVVQRSEKKPIFIVGLPRTGTTLVERILSSHSQVASLGETLFLQMGLMRLSGVSERAVIDTEIISALKDKNFSQLAAMYRDAVAYRLGEEPRFIEKLPFNFLYAGFIAKAWPEANIIHLVRDPMDACFSMYKQVFTWAYKFSYSLPDLGRYYVAYDRLRRHWKQILGERFIEVRYEDVVTNQESETRDLLHRLGLPFEAQCLDFEKNSAPSTTASSVQVRGKVHTGSVQKWRRFETQLEPLANYLREHGIELN